MSAVKFEYIWWTNLLSKELPLLNKSPWRLHFKALKYCQKEAEVLKMPCTRCIDCKGGFQKGLKCLFKCPLYFQVVAEGAFLCSLFNVMMKNNLPNFFKCSLATTIPSYCTVVLRGTFSQYRFSYHCEIEFFLHHFHYSKR